ncbi:hypothetical protein D3C85_1341180 [compost metagenome]
MRGIGNRLLDHALHLLDFFHQVQLRRQAAGGVGDDDVDAAGHGSLHRIVADGGGVAALLCDHGDVVALTPGNQLFAGGSTEGVTGGQ